ncbi:aspartyl/glutamyl-tRNA amidotransferase subunit B [Candidatus Termititenax dinenymphae]|uniref:Aspartyl/glutamyl-tRNA(Asn/Gln) amidotransferase subunit B n=1 Tax=Candidatus Termititenax dinenymphae TaxID=2218523 RepID=A0A388TJ76_9BACT|nr:aspartyl/glutamyl-tRNA amidotransferase subunit B [Candidatus Termititenax dinenymphae]
MTEYEAVIGLEIHTQLKTKSKIFCGCSTEFGNNPNSNICPVCTGQPGALPVLNKEVVNLAIRCGLVLDCTINKKSVFARKNYFYPDLPKAYQISQFDLPVTQNGFVNVVLPDGTEKRIGITRAHLEEDAGKLVHQGAEGIEGATSSHVDLNRSSVPLLEIVSEPDIRSAEEARAYLEKIKSILQFADISEANMEEGQLRCDANVSIRPIGQKEFGVKAEIKNMNSFRAVEKAIKIEIDRQKQVLSSGKKVIQETRSYDEASGKTVSMRSKEESHDYRYFPEPDLLPLIIDDAWIAQIKKDLPELAEQRIARYQEAYGISAYDARVLTLDKAVSDFFDTTAKLYSGDKKTIVNWLTTDILGYLKNENLEIGQTKLTPQNLVEMLGLIDNKTISGKIAKDLIGKMIATGESAKKLVESTGMQQITDENEIQKIVQEVIDANPKQLEQYRSGKTALKGYFVGETMKRTKGKASPQVVNQLLDKLLG